MFRHTHMHTNLEAQRLRERLVWIRRLVQRPDARVARFHHFTVDSARQLQNKTHRDKIHINFKPL